MVSTVTKEHIDSDGFTIFAAATFPLPWPVKQKTIFLSGTINDYQYQMSFISSKRIKISIVTKYNQIFSAKSCMINLTRNHNCDSIICITFNEFREITIHVNGRQANFSNEDIHIDPINRYEFNSKEIKYDEKGFIDMKININNSLDSLKSRAVKSGIDYAKIWSFLEQRVADLPIKRDRAVKGGRGDLGDLSVSLRALLAPGRGNELLLLCAADIDASLPVWSLPMPLPNAWTPEHMLLPADGSLSGIAKSIPFGSLSMFELNPTDTHSYCVDLQLWLRTHNGILLSKKITPLQLLKEVADKQGAHSDLFGLENVEQLSQASVNGREYALDFLSELAERVHTIGQGLIRARNIKLK